MQYRIIIHFSERSSDDRMNTFISGFAMSEHINCGQHKWNIILNFFSEKYNYSS